MSFFGDEDETDMLVNSSPHHDGRGMRHDGGTMARRRVVHNGANQLGYDHGAPRKSYEYKVPEYQPMESVSSESKGDSWHRQYGMNDSHRQVPPLPPQSMPYSSSMHSVDRSSYPPPQYGNHGYGDPRSADRIAHKRLPSSSYSHPRHEIAGKGHAYPDPRQPEAHVPIGYSMPKSIPDAPEAYTRQVHQRSRQEPIRRLPPPQQPLRDESLPPQARPRHRAVSQSNGSNSAFVNRPHSGSSPGYPVSRQHQPAPQMIQAQPAQISARMHSMSAAAVEPQPIPSSSINSSRPLRKGEAEPAPVIRVRNDAGFSRRAESQGVSSQPTRTTSSFSYVIAQPRLFWYFYKEYTATVAPRTSQALQSIRNQQLHDADTPDKKCALVDAFIHAIGKNIFTQTYYRFDKECCKIYWNMMKVKNERVLKAIDAIVQEKGRRAFTLPALEGYAREAAGDDNFMKEITPILWQQVRNYVNDLKSRVASTESQTGPKVESRPQIASSKPKMAKMRSNSASVRQSERLSAPEARVDPVNSQPAGQRQRSLRLQESRAPSNGTDSRYSALRRNENTAVDVVKDASSQALATSAKRRYDRPRRYESANKSNTGDGRGQVSMTGILTTLTIMQCLNHGSQKAKTEILVTTRGASNTKTLDYIRRALEAVMNNFLVDLLGFCHHRCEGVVKRIALTSAEGKQEHVKGYGNTIPNQPTSRSSSAFVGDVFRLIANERKVKTELRLKELDLELLHTAILERSNTGLDTKRPQKFLYSRLQSREKGDEDNNENKKRILHSEWRRGIVGDGGNYLEKCMEAEKFLVKQNYENARRYVEREILNKLPLPAVDELTDGQKDLATVRQLVPLSKNKPVVVSVVDMRALLNALCYERNSSWEAILRNLK